MIRHVDALKNKHNCSGCTACMVVCPKHCIRMRRDEEGFLYPLVDENNCIECGICKKVCPFTKDNYKRPQQAYDVPVVFAAKHKQNDVRISSTSGGLFTAISDLVLSQGGAVCGAVFDQKYQNSHQILNYHY